MSEASKNSSRSPLKTIEAAPSMAAFLATLPLMREYMAATGPAWAESMLVRTLPMIASISDHCAMVCMTRIAWTGLSMKARVPQKTVASDRTRDRGWGTMAMDSKDGAEDRRASAEPLADKDVETRFKRAVRNLLATPKAKGGKLGRGATGGKAAPARTDERRPK